MAGQYAVAEVTMNRKASRFYPKTVCEVVYQREAFSWTGTRNLEALSLYRHTGYRHRGPFGNYPTNDPLSVFMEKQLG